MHRILDFFRKGRAPQPVAANTINLAFVLLEEASLPEPSAVIQSFRDFEPQGGLEVVEAEAPHSPEAREVLSFSWRPGQLAYVALVPVPVPKGEADEGAKFSLGSIGTNWTLRPHGAHLVVTSTATLPSSRIDELSRFTSFLAAVARASNSLGIYWGSAGATHGTEFFTSVATEQDVLPRLMLWTGVSIARDGDNRLSLLSLGMRQLGLPDLLLTAPASSGSDALGTFFDFLSYLATRGEAIPDGDTLGRSSDERLEVRYVASPVDPAKKVWSVDLP